MPDIYSYIGQDWLFPFRLLDVYDSKAYHAACRVLCDSIRMAVGWRLEPTIVDLEAQLQHYDAAKRERQIREQQLWDSRLKGLSVSR